MSSEISAVINAKQLMPDKCEAGVGHSRVNGLGLCAVQGMPSTPKPKNTSGPRKSRGSAGSSFVTVSGSVQTRAKSWGRRSPERWRRTRARVRRAEATAALCADPWQSSSAARPRLSDMTNFRDTPPTHGNHRVPQRDVLGPISIGPVPCRRLRPKSACDLSTPAARDLTLRIFPSVFIFAHRSSLRHLHSCPSYIAHATSSLLVPRLPRSAS